MTTVNPSAGVTSEFSLAYQIAGPYVDLASAKVFLEGPYASGLMGTSLQSAGDLPVIQPYGASYLNGSLAEYDDPVTTDYFPPNTVDWISLSLRSTIDPADEVSRRVAFVRNDGTIVNYTGQTTVKLPGAPAGNYYLVVCHRNHLCAMSSAAVDFTSGTGTWDFATDLTQAYSGGGAPMKALGDGNFGLFSADNNADGQVTAPDFNQWNAETTAGATGYQRGDHNLDGIVTAPDFNQWNANTTAGASSQVPN
jgi:hypothetical protein